MIKLAIYRKRDQTTRGRGRRGERRHRKEKHSQWWSACDCFDAHRNYRFRPPIYFRIKTARLQIRWQRCLYASAFFYSFLFDRRKKKYKIFPNQQPSVYQPDFSPKVVPVDVALHYNRLWTYFYLSSIIILSDYKFAKKISWYCDFFYYYYYNKIFYPESVWKNNQQNLMHGL